MRQKWIRYHKRKAREFQRWLERLRYDEKRKRFALVYSMGPRKLREVFAVGDAAKIAYVMADFSKIETRITEWYRNELVQGRTNPTNVPHSNVTDATGGSDSVKAADER